MKKTYIILGIVLAILLLSAYLVMQKQGEQDLSAGSAEKFAPLDSLIAYIPSNSTPSPCP